MKAKLEFNLPEEKNEYTLATKGSHYFSVLYELDQLLRGYLKYGHKFKTPDEAIDTIRGYVRGEIDFEEIK